MPRNDRFDRHFHRTQPTALKELPFEDEFPKPLHPVIAIILSVGIGACLIVLWTT